MLKNKKAFTLIEILIVVVIIGIMASLTIPRLTGQPEKARVAEAVGILSAMRRGQEIYYNEHGDYFRSAGGAFYTTTNDWVQLGMEPPQTNFWTFGVRGSGRDDTAVLARREALSTPPNSSTEGNFIYLFIGPGTWSGSGDYGQGGPYAPQK